MIKLVDRYVGRTALLGVLAVWFGLTLLMSMFTLLDQLGETSGGVSLQSVFYYVLLKAPGAAYVVFPVASLLGALIGVGALAAANELVAFRTAGASRLRISGSVLGAVLVLTLGVMALGEWVMPPAEAQARALKDSRVAATGRSGASGLLWIRDGDRFINVDRSIVQSDEAVTDGGTLINVVEFAFSPERSLERVTQAKKAVHDGQSWQLYDSTERRLDDAAVSRQVSDQREWSVGFGPELLRSAVTRPRYMSMRGIMDQLAYLRQNGLDARAYNSVLWSKALYPLTVLALVLAGMPFLFGSSRSQSIGLRIFIGMTLGGVFMIVSRTMQNFADAYAMPAFVGTALPSLALAAVIILILRRSV
ncbi:MAG: LPS export ABC transporter permease LptG [Xanthomonadales bacterium]|nr:LPS export ABC transporter permease LptG [Xanthomonadales bacterium]